MLYPLWDIDADRFGDLTEDELTRTASSVRADEEFMSALTRAAASAEPVYAASDHVELQIYGGNFFSDGDRDLCRQFHGLPWERRPEIAGRFGDQRLKRLARRLIYLESPHLLDEADAASSRPTLRRGGAARKSRVAAVDDDRSSSGGAGDHRCGSVGGVQERFFRALMTVLQLILVALTAPGHLRADTALFERGRAVDQISQEHFVDFGEMDQVHMRQDEASHAHAKLGKLPFCH